MDPSVCPLVRPPVHWLLSQVEARLRARVQELSEYRAAGLRTFEQVDALEAVLGEGARKKGEAPVDFLFFFPRAAHL